MLFIILKINLKIKSATRAGLKVIFCIGETLKQKRDKTTNQVLNSQLKKGLKSIKKINDIIIAYEPVWAIGTGVTASPEQAQEVHAFIRAQLVEMYSAELADSITILYGGSCKPSNAADLFSGADLDGGLIGGASLKADDFLEIVAILADSKK